MKTTIQEQFKAIDRLLAASITENGEIHLNQADAVAVSEAMNEIADEIHKSE